MKTFYTLCLIIFLSFVSLSASAVELSSKQSHALKLGELVVFIYVTENDDEYEVVTTAATENSHEGSPIRYVAYLLPGQKTAFYVSNGTFEKAHTLEMKRVNNKIIVNVQA